jgi:TonB family protein
VSLAVDRILERRARREGRPEATSVAVALLLHAGALAAVLLLPRLSPPPPPMTFVPVEIVPAQALGVRHPANPANPAKTEKPKPAPEKPPKPEPEPPKPEPKPEPPVPKPKPVREPVHEDTPVLPDKPSKHPEKPKPTATTPLPRPAAPSDRKPLPRPPSPATPQTPQTNEGGETGPRGAPTGKPQGSSAFGSQVAGLDNPDFKFGYYIDGLLSAIDSKWVRPPLGNDVQAVIGFRIQRDGSIAELEVTRSSGYNSFDLAALRAVQNASPFPPLPRAYRESSLGVSLIVR